MRYLQTMQHAAKTRERQVIDRCTPPLESRYINTPRSGAERKEGGGGMGGFCDRLLR